MGSNILFLKAEDIDEFHTDDVKQTKDEEIHKPEDSKHHQITSEISCIGGIWKNVFSQFYISIVKPKLTTQGLQCVNMDTDTAIIPNTMAQDNNHSQQQELFDTFTMIDFSSESMCLADIYAEEILFGLCSTKAEG